MYVVSYLLPLYTVLLKIFPLHLGVTSYILVVVLLYRHSVHDLLSAVYLPKPCRDNISDMWNILDLSFGEQVKKPCVAPRSHCLCSRRIKGCHYFSLWCDVSEGQTICLGDAVDSKVLWTQQNAHKNPKNIVTHNDILVMCADIKGILSPFKSWSAVESEI